jgi:hypothetical protein
MGVYSVTRERPVMAAIIRGGSKGKKASGVLRESSMPLNSSTTKDENGIFEGGGG